MREKEIREKIHTEKPGAGDGCAYSFPVDYFSISRRVFEVYKHVRV